MRIEPGKTTLLAIAALAVLAIGLAPEVTRGDEETTERFRANAISAGGGRSGTTTIDIDIERWSSDEERSKLLEAVQTNNPDEMIGTMRGFDRVGTARLRNRLSYDIQYSREIVDGGTRTVILATDRPIAMEEARRRSRTMDHNVSIIQMQLDEEGNGEGTLMVGAELVWDAETETLEVTQFTTQPVRLTNIRHRN